jgi:hypothetical protein
MRLFSSFFYVTLISSFGLAVIDAQAQDGQACQAIINKGNDLNGQIGQVRKKANDEDECNAEAKLWAEAANLVEQRISIAKQTIKICAGFNVTGGITIDELTDRAAQMRKYEARAKDGCDPPQPTQPTKAQNLDDLLVGSGTITCFGGGDCNAQSKTRPSADSGAPNPVPKGRASTITGKQFGDQEPAGGSGKVTTAK